MRFFALLLLVPSLACAGGVMEMNLFVKALQDGTASEPLTANGQFTTLQAKLQRQTGDSSPIIIRAARLLKFKQQARCGRIAFALVQPSSNHVWPQLGGQLNICEDGLPPWRICANQHDRLVRYNAKCTDGSQPVDSPEVAQAISNAIATGEVSPEQASKEVKEQIRKKKDAPAQEKDARS